jgi:radical SAM-linked protein
MKYLITFEKGESVRWLGHLDILRTFERAIRRAELPIAFTAGFNPRERLAFASALSVGITAAAEPATIELTDTIDPSELIWRLNEKLPPGIQLRTAEDIPDAGSRDLLNSYDRAEFRVTCVTQNAPGLDSAARAAESLLARDSLVVEREREGKVKRIDIRPFVHSVSADEIQNGRIAFTMILGIGMDGVAKPQEIVALMANDVPGLAVRRIHRERLLSRDTAEAPPPQHELTHP